MKSWFRLTMQLYVPYLNTRPQRLVNSPQYSTSNLKKFKDGAIGWFADLNLAPSVHVVNSKCCTPAERKQHWNFFAKHFLLITFSIPLFQNALPDHRDSSNRNLSFHVFVIPLYRMQLSLWTTFQLLHLRTFDSTPSCVPFFPISLSPLYVLCTFFLLTF